MGFYHNISCGLIPPEKSALYVEVAYSKDKPINKKHIAFKIKKSLGEVGIINSTDTVCLEDVNDIEFGYPIYDRYYSRARNAITRYLMSNNVVACGRFGSWRYMSMEDAILDGKKTAELINDKL